MNMLKTFLGLALFLTFSVAGFAQITINEYDKKQVAFVDQTDDLPRVTATSSCGEVSVSIEEKVFSGGCLGTLVRTYTFTDDCGATAEAEQYISRKDNTAPEFSQEPEDIVLAPGDELPPMAKVIATDNSGATPKMDITVVDKKNGILRTWTATDQCGNATSVSQSITYGSL